MNIYRKGREVNVSRRLEAYEEVQNHRVLPNMPTIIRLDGHKFGNISKLMAENSWGIKPFSPLFEEGMEKAARSVVAALDGTVQLVYFGSDEISVLLDWHVPTDTGGVRDALYAGRVQKLVSLTAGAASMGFSLRTEYEAYFDAQIIQMPRSDVGAYFSKRQRKCRNSFVYTATHHSAMRLYGESSRKVRLLLMHTGVEEKLQWYEDNMGTPLYNVHPESYFTGKELKKNTKSVPIRQTMSLDKWQDLLSKGYVEEGQTTNVSSWRAEIARDFSHWDL